MLTILASLALSLFQSPAPAEPAPIRVACVGDSITEGDGAPKDQSYPAHLGRMLEEIAPGGYQVFNFGASGATLLDGTHRPYRRDPAWTRSLECKPDVVLFNLGINDSNHGFWNGSADEFEQGLNEVLNAYAALESHPQVYLATLTRMHAAHPDFEKGKANRETVDDVVLKVAKARNLPIIDYGWLTSSRQDWFPDGLHPNAHGYEQMAREIVRVAFRPAWTRHCGSELLAIFEKAHAEGNLNGSVCLLERDQVLLDRSFVSATEESTAEPIARRVYDLGVLSDRVLCIGATRFEDAAGKIRDIRAHLPEFPYPNFSLGTLLDHSSDLISMEDLVSSMPDTDQGKATAEPESGARALLNWLVETKPALLSTRYACPVPNELDSILAALTLQSAAAKPYAQLVREHLADPLDLQSLEVPSDLMLTLHLKSNAFDLARLEAASWHFRLFNSKFCSTFPFSRAINTDWSRPCEYNYVLGLIADGEWAERQAGPEGKQHWICHWEPADITLVVLQDTPSKSVNWQREVHQVLAGFNSQAK
ncbi:MAG: GDSL-type esterase/lipase family protein [Planctomycetota bacterium]